MSRALAGPNQSPAALSAIEVAHVLAASVRRLVAMGVTEQVAVRLVALDNKVTANCVRAAMRIALRGDQA